MRGHRSAAALALAAVAVAVAVVVAVGVRLLSADGSPQRLAANADGGAIVQLEALREPAPARSGSLCRDVAAAPGAAMTTTVLECDERALFTADRGRCAADEGYDPARRCQVLTPSLAAVQLGWTITREAGGTRYLAVYIGARAASGDDSSSTFEQRYEAVDDSGRWLELSVCPADLDGNGSLELVIVARRSAGAGSRAVGDTELVVLSPAVTEAGEQALPVLQSALLADTDLDRRGAGCTSGVVARLGARNGHLVLAGA